MVDRLTKHGWCGKTWTQRGNSTSHCAECHQTFSTLSLFDKHRKDGACHRLTGNQKQDEEGVWWTPQGLANLRRLQDKAKDTFKKGDETDGDDA